MDIVQERPDEEEEEAMRYPPFYCRFGDGEAIAIWDMPGGCMCYPEDRAQALCLQHSRRATPLDGMTLLFDLTLGHRFTEAVLQT